MRLAFLLINTQGVELLHHCHHCVFIFSIWVWVPMCCRKKLYTELHIMNEEEWKGVHEVTDHWYIFDISRGDRLITDQQIEASLIVFAQFWSLLNIIGVIISTNIIIRINNHHFLCHYHRYHHQEKVVREPFLWGPLLSTQILWFVTNLTMKASYKLPRRDAIHALVLDDHLQDSWCKYLM